MTNWHAMEMVQATGETEYCVIIDCPEGDVYYKFCVTQNDSDSQEWVVDSRQEIVASGDGRHKVQANVINIKKTDREVFSALTVDSYCVKKGASEHEEEEREKSDTGWTQEKPQLESEKSKEKGPPILPPHLLQVLLNKEELSIHSIKSRDDRVRLPEPQSHVMLNHLYAQSIRDNTLVLASTARYKKKCVTIVYYKDLSQDNDWPRS